VGELRLTPKQEKFCNKYLECGNASEAYRFAYDCSKMKDSTINRKAVELLANGKITASVSGMQAEQKAKSDITKEYILKKLQAIADSKITDYVYFDGSEIKFYDFSLLSEKQIEAIESIKHGRYGIEIRLHGKSWTIERICKMLGFDAPLKNEHTGKDGSDLFPAMDLSKLSIKELKLYHQLQEKASAKNT